MRYMRLPIRVCYSFCDVSVDVNSGAALTNNFPFSKGVATSLVRVSILLHEDEEEVIEELPAPVADVLAGVDELAGYVSNASTIRVNPFPARRIIISRAHLS